MGRTCTRGVVGLVALALSLALVGKGGPALAQAKKSDSVVKATATADKPGDDGKQTVTITLDIEKPWHLYANPVENEDLVSVQTVVSLAGRAKLDNVKIEYPAGKLHAEKEEKYKIYEGKITIKAQVKRAAGDDSPLEASIKVQACSDKTCLFPATIKVPVR